MIGKNSFHLHIANLGLRGITIALRFLFIIGLSKYYSTEDLGIYGLFTTTVTIVIFFLGFDFYAYAHREILKVDKYQQPNFLYNSLIFFLLTYVIVLPSCLFFFFFNILPLKYIVWFYLILVFEHLSQELFRLYVLFGNQVFANFLLFVRMSSWTIIVFAVWAANDLTELRLNYVFALWMLGSFISVGLGFIGILKRYGGGSKNSFYIDKKWIREGVPIAVKFLIGTLAYKLIEFSDRYFIDYFLDRKAVGVYTFYYNFANVLQTLVFTLVIAQLYPKMVEYFVKKDLFNYDLQKSKFKQQVIGTSLIGSVIVILIIYPAIYIVGKPEFYDNLDAYIVLIVAIVLLNISFIPHYILYTRKMDNEIMICTVFSALANLASNLVLTERFGLLGSAISTLFSYFLLTMSKYYFVLKEIKR